jgi:hypothetical protein
MAVGRRSSDTERYGQVGDVAARALIFVASRLSMAIKQSFQKKQEDAAWLIHHLI